ncbi:MAG TPA: S1 RNA-binding domain-containing protein [Haloplasmataceae bacterium]
MAIIKEGSVVRGRVTGIQPYGVFVKLKDNMNGLIHISELTDSYVRDVRDYVKIGQMVRVKVLEINPETNNARLSLKQARNYYTYFQEKKRLSNNRIKETPSGFKNLGKMLKRLIETREGGPS